LRDAGSIPATSTKVSKALLDTIPLKETGVIRCVGSALTDVILPKLATFGRILGKRRLMLQAKSN
jgi:hypothetical protein